MINSHVIYSHVIYSHVIDSHVIYSHVINSHVIQIPYSPCLLLCVRLIENCPLASMKNDVTMETSDHVRNLSDSINKPLYMECEYYCNIYNNYNLLFY